MTTCHQVTDWLLQAEPGEIVALRDHAIAEHLGSCERCRARAARVANDSLWLARVVTHSAPVHGGAIAVAAQMRAGRRHLAAFVAGGLLAASLMLVVGLRSLRREPSRPNPSRATIAVAPPMHSLAAPSEPVDVTRPATHSVARARARSPRRALPVAYAAARPLRIVPAYLPATPEPAVRLDTVRALVSTVSHVERTTAAVDVEPSPSRRYSVIRADPRITVIWFY
jgi:hypothetical protein